MNQAAVVAPRPKARGPRLRGEIVSLHPSGSYGFIKVPDRDKHIYIGRTTLELMPAVMVGDTVEFTLHDHHDAGKVSARDVRIT